MSLTDKFATPPEKPVRCLACDWLNTRSADDLEAIKMVVNDPSWTVAAIWKVLQSEGMKASQSSFRLHITNGH